MGSRIRRWLRWVGLGLVLTSVRVGRRLRRVFLAIPKALWDYVGRLAWAVFAVRVRRRFPSVIRVIGQVFRTLLRGAPVVLILAVAIGLGLGVVADRFGEVLRPLVEQTFLLTIAGDALPIILALLLTARMGSSIAARISDNRVTRFNTDKANPRELLHHTLAHLIAGAVSGWLLYRISSALVVSGFRTAGDLPDLVSDLLASVTVPLDRELPLDRAIGEGSIRSALFGFIIALVACAVGLATNEAKGLSPRRRGIAQQDAVWESGVMALILCLIAAIIWWNVRGTSA